MRIPSVGARGIQYGDSVRLTLPRRRAPRAAPAPPAALAALTLRGSRLPTAARGPARARGPAPRPLSHSKKFSDFRVSVRCARPRENG